MKRYFYVCRQLLGADRSVINYGFDIITVNGSDHFNLKYYQDKMLEQHPEFVICIVTFFKELSLNDYNDFFKGQES